MFKQDGELKRILIEFAGLLTYLGLAIALWQITSNPRDIAIYLLMTFCFILLVRYYLMHKHLAQLKSTLETTGQNALELQRVQGLLEGMLGLWLFTTEFPSSDTKHHFTTLEEEYTIRGDNGFYNWKIQGFNTLDEPSQALTIKFSGDAPVDIASLSLSVVDNLTGQRYHEKQINIIKDLPYLKIFNVRFPKPLEKEEFFDLRLSCRWDNTFPRSRKCDYVFFPLGHYASKGIDKLVVRLVSDITIDDFILYRLDTGRLVKERTQPRIVDTSRRRFILEWETSNPQHVYVLRFSKEVDYVQRIATEPVTEENIAVPISSLSSLLWKD